MRDDFGRKANRNPIWKAGGSTRPDATRGAASMRGHPERSEGSHNCSLEHGPAIETTGTLCGVPRYARDDT
jgi:hypothetical protein